MQTYSKNPACFRDALKLTKSISPYFPLVVRMLLVSTFIEDGVRVLFELPLQSVWLTKVYGIPRYIGSSIIVVNLVLSFSASAIILMRRNFLRGKYEGTAAYVLIGSIVYQQISYGSHTPAVLGKFGFLVRNLCLSGAILLVSCQARVASGKSALPMGILGSTNFDISKGGDINGIGNGNSTVSYMQLASRFLLVLLALEFMVTFGNWGSLLSIPIVFAVLIGFKLELSGSILLGLYMFHNVTNSAFWHRSHTVYMAEVLQYEFFQTLSIMCGLLMLILDGPGEFSMDGKLRKKSI